MSDDIQAIIKELLAKVPERGKYHSSQISFGFENLMIQLYEAY